MNSLGRQWVALRYVSMLLIVLLLLFHVIYFWVLGTFIGWVCFLGGWFSLTWVVCSLQNQEMRSSKWWLLDCIVITYPLSVVALYSILYYSSKM